MGIMAGIGGAVGGLAGLFGGGANNVQMPPMFNMPNMGGAANNAYGGIGNLQGMTSGASNTAGSAAGQTFGNFYQNPFAGGYQSSAGIASDLGQNAALGMYGVGGNMIGMGQSMIPNAQQVFNTAMDPQSQLYNYMQNQNQQQTQALASSAGLGTTPYGVGVEAQGNQLFNMNWQNQQLGRQIAGLGAYGQALGQSGQLQGAGTSLQNNAPGAYMNASAMPFNTFQGIGGAQNSMIQQYLGNMSGAAGLQNMPIQDYLGYLGVGNQANSVANQNAQLQLQQQQQQFNQQMQLGAMLGGSMYGLGQNGFNIFSGGSGGMGSPFGNMMGFGGGLGGTYINGTQMPYGSINYNPIQQGILSGNMNP